MLFRPHMLIYVGLSSHEPLAMLFIAAMAISCLIEMIVDIVWWVIFVVHSPVMKISIHEN